MHDKIFIEAEYGWSTISPLTSHVLKGNGLIGLCTSIFIIINTLNIFCKLYIYIRYMPFRTKTRQEQLAKEERAKIKLANTAYILTVNKQLTKKNIDEIKAKKMSLLDLPVDILDKIFNEHYKELLKNVLRSWIPIDEIYLYYLCDNTNINAMTILKTLDPDNLDWKALSSNPSAIELLSLPENYNRIDWKSLSGNPDAIKLLKKKIKEEKGLTEQELNTLPIHQKIDWNKLSGNLNAIELLIANKKNINWDNLSGNPNAIHLIKEKIEHENNILTEEEYDDLNYKEKIDWEILSSNPSINASKYLSLPENYSNIFWDKLSGNPNKEAIKLLKKKIKEEKRLSEHELNALPIYQKIDWYNLSSNYGAIKLLQMNQDKIRWETLSANPKAISLIIKRIIKEEKPGYNHEKINNNINWSELSANPKAIKILENNKEKIIWKDFSTNPSIFALDRGNNKSSSSKKSSSPNAKQTPSAKSFPTNKPLRITGSRRVNKTI
jgi:hypothetical protein